MTREVMNNKQSKDFLGLTPGKIKYAIRGREVTLGDFIRDINSLVSVNLELHRANSNHEITKGRLKQAEKDNERLEKENLAMTNALARVVKKRKEAERDLYRLQHNVYKFIAAKLAELEDVDYTSLEEVDKHYWREFVALEMKWFMG